MSDTSKILLANFPKINQFASFQQIDGTNSLDILTGYDINVDPKEVSSQIVSDLAMALLTYDQVLILGNNVYDVIQVWTSGRFKALLREGIVKVIPDSEFNPVLKKEGDGVWKPSFFGYANGYTDTATNKSYQFDHKFGHIEKTLACNNWSATDLNALIYLLEENEYSIDLHRITQSIETETEKDMHRLEFLTNKDFFRLNNGDLEYNMVSKLRLHHLNSLLGITASKGIDALKTDGAIAQLMRKKISSVFAATNIPNGIDSLTCITKEKGFPELGQLIRSNVISLDDLLKLRDSFNGKMFRFWAKMDDYEEDQMRKDIMNSVHEVLGHNVSQLIRMTSCSVAGLVGFIPGVAATAIDSFIVGKAVLGWHPNFFLDNKLKALIDKRVADERSRAERAEIEARFKGVGRNDPCPCGSGKKFKNCHGKQL